MTDFRLYFELGLHHVLDWNAYDHVLFIAAFSVLYSLLSWKRLLGLVTAFTVGHTISLCLAHYDIFSPPATWVEFLIPVTIVYTALQNLWSLKIKADERAVWNYFFVVLFFGIVHGFGFGREFGMINIDKAFQPLLYFALGIEASQVIVVLLISSIGFVLQKYFKLTHAYWVGVVSIAVILFTTPILIENWPF